MSGLGTKHQGRKMMSLESKEAQDGKRHLQPNPPPINWGGGGRPLVEKVSKQHQQDLISLPEPEGATHALLQLPKSEKSKAGRKRIPGQEPPCLPLFPQRALTSHLKSSLSH